MTPLPRGPIRLCGSEPGASSQTEPFSGADKPVQVCSSSLLSIAQIRNSCTRLAFFDDLGLELQRHAQLAFQHSMAVSPLVSCCFWT